MSSHNVWLLCRKQQRMRLKRSMLCPASNRMRRCQEKAAVPRGCQCALERFFYFLKGQQNSCKKKRPDPTLRTISPIFLFQKKKKMLFLSAVHFFTRLIWPGPFLLLSYVPQHIKTKPTVCFIPVTKLLHSISPLLFAFIQFSEDIIHRMWGGCRT